MPWRGPQSQQAWRRRHLGLGAAAALTCLTLTGLGAARGQPPSDPQGTLQVRPAPPAPWEKAGLSASLGLGYGYGLLGFQARYDFPLRWWLHVSPFVGGGTAAGFTTEHPVGAVGLSTSLGMRHRLAVDVAIAPVGIQQLNLHGVVVDHRTMYGPLVAGGYELVRAGGFFGRLLVGYAWGQWTQGAWEPVSETTFTLGLGARLW